MTHGRRWGVAAFLVGALASETIVGDEMHASGRKPAIPEQILTESVTDIDADEAGEAEIVLNVQTLRARRGGARVYTSGLEIEWRVLRDVGLRLEPSYAATQDEARSRDHEFGLSAAGSYALLHDFARDIHVQAEARLQTELDAWHAAHPGPITAGDLKGSAAASPSLRCVSQRKWNRRTRRHSQRYNSPIK